MRVIGTAGHVDHGKSTLIEALTGIHPDRLREEREREMTIVLGFAWLTLPNGEEVGIVDVPGHRDFIENMLSGIGAIDAALFIVAADEGVMPQTREHLAILDLLQIQGGVVSLTKIDLIDDPDWLDLVEMDVRETLSGTVLAEAPLVRVSARSGEGLEELIRLLEEILSERPPRPDLGRPRLPVDRVFSMPGFGTVVTGTLSDGHLSVGDDVVILPQGVRGRIRGLQTHKRKESTAVPGSRTAVNISGVDMDQIQRGDVITHPGAYSTTRRLDLSFRSLPDITQPIRHNMDVKLFIGAAEVLGRLRLLGTEVLNPGEEGWLQLELASPVVAIRGDRYILRRPSPGETLGGGVVVDPRPKGRHKRFDQHVLNRLESLAEGTPVDVLLQAMLASGIAPLREVIERSSLEQKLASQALETMLQTGQALFLEGHAGSPKSTDLITTQIYWSQLKNQVSKELQEYHQTYPLRQGIPREELKSRLKVSPRIFNLMMTKLITEGDVVETNLRKDLPGVNPIPVLYRPGYVVQFSAEQNERIKGLLRKFAENPYSPPSVKDCVAEVGEDLFNALIDLGKLMPVSGDVVFRWEDYQKWVSQVRDLIAKEGTISVAQMRDRFDTSRRYVLAFLEHLDVIGMTVRDGDVRRLKN